jgi:hypothetical protein
MTKEKMAAEEQHKGSGASSGGHSYTPIQWLFSWKLVMCLSLDMLYYWWM